jgi:hypothetical protein
MLYSSTAYTAKRYFSYKQTYLVKPPIAGLINIP